MAHSSSLATLSADLSAIVQGASAFVVSVDARPRRPASGIVSGPELVITADHVVERDDDLSVVVDGAAHAATLAGRDEASDIAVLKVPGLKAPPAPRAEGVPPVGSLVVSVSRTGSGGVSAGLGLVSAIGGPLRTGRGVVFPQVVRTDAAARPGMSGGAIVGPDGRVIAMTTTAFFRGFPVGLPATKVWEIASALASNQGVRRGFLGVSVHPVRLPQRQGDRGLLVFGLARDGAADRAGVLVGDVIVRFNDHEVADADALQDALAGVEPGKEVTLGILRGGAPQQVSVTIRERPRD
jgi:S1-C subfamily serine protease